MITKEYLWNESCASVVENAYPLECKPGGLCVPVVPIRIEHPSIVGRVATVMANVNMAATRSCFPGALRELLQIPAHGQGLARIEPLGLEIISDLRWTKVQILDVNHNSCGEEHLILAVYPPTQGTVYATLGMDILRHYEVYVGRGKLLLRKMS